MATETQVLGENGPECQLGAVLVRVRKPKLKDYTRFLMVVAEIRMTVNIEALFSNNPADSGKAWQVLAEVPEKVALVCSLASDATIEQAQEADLEQAIDLFVACVKYANVVGAISGALKKVWGATETEAP